MTTTRVYVSWRDYPEERRFGWLLGTRADGTHEVSAGYHGVEVLPPHIPITYEEQP